MLSYLRCVPIEPPPSPWVFPQLHQTDEYGIVGIGADLEPGTLLAAYRRGVFPMPIDGLDSAAEIGWWSPDPRGILELDDLRVSRSLARSCRRYQVTVNRAFGVVIEKCATIPRDGGWISPAIQDAYIELHRLGWAHSVEVWEDDVMVGGLYGVGIGGFFAGESMFHLATDASKVALVELVRRLQGAGASFVDVQWCTPHLATLGVQEMSRDRYLLRLVEAVEMVNCMDIAFEMSR